MTNRCKFLFLSLLMLLPTAAGLSGPQQTDDRDFQSTIDRLSQADREHISVLHESYLHSIEVLGIDDPFTAQLRNRLLLESDPVSLTEGHLLIDLLTDLHAQSDADIETITLLLLDLWKRFDEHAEANPLPTETVWLNMSPPGGRYPSGIAPSAINEPEIRAEYEEILRKNRENAMQLNRAVRAEQAQKRFRDHLKLIVQIMSQELSEKERDHLLDAIGQSGRDDAEEMLNDLRARLS